jgi:hypothetical protein
MTATSVMTPTIGTRSWKTMQLVAMVAVAVVVFSVFAFVAGRASVDARRVIVPVPAAAVSPTGGELDAGRCPIGRPC